MPVLPSFTTNRVLRAMDVSIAQHTFWNRAGALRLLDNPTSQGRERVWTVRDVYQLAIIRTLTKLINMKADVAAGAARVTVDAVDEHTITHVHELFIVYTPAGTEIRFNQSVMETPPPVDIIAELRIDLRRLFDDVRRRFQESEPRLDPTPATASETVQ